MANQTNDYRPVAIVSYQSDMPLEIALMLWQQNALVVPPVEQADFCDRVSHEMRNVAKQISAMTPDLYELQIQLKASTSHSETERLNNQIRSITWALSPLNDKVEGYERMYWHPPIHDDQNSDADIVGNEP